MKLVFFVTRYSEGLYSVEWVDELTSSLQTANKWRGQHGRVYAIFSASSSLMISVSVKGPTTNSVRLRKLKDDTVIHTEQWSKCVLV